MPSGYTSDLYEGKDISFEEFMHKMARGMGFAIMQRDSGPGKVSFRRANADYSIKSLNDELDKLEEFIRSDRGTRRKMYASEMNDRRAWSAESKKEKAAIRKRYQDMLDQVNAWECPEILTSFKEFVIKQLEESIEFDCKEYSWNDEKISYETWENQKLSLRMIRLTLESIERSIKNADETNEYVEALYNSLDG